MLNDIVHMTIVFVDFKLANVVLTITILTLSCLLLLNSDLQQGHFDFR
jgi:hypothetical protein